jgi:hypothetical protein
MTVIAVVADIASASETQMVLPSRTTAAQLDALSHKANVIADVLAVDRREYMLKLDGSGGGALSGQDEDGSAMRIPLDRVALVYYVQPPVAKKKASGSENKTQAELAPSFPAKRTFPSVAAVSAAERGMDCGELDVETGRVGAIRWYARHYGGVVPFTDHEARTQHGKNALEYAGVGLVVLVDLAGLVAGGRPLLAPSSLGNQEEAFRWAVTAADRREISLLQLKRARSCPARVTPSGQITDLEILTAVESTRGALESHQISDVDQRDQQTQLLDRLDPPTSAAAEAASHGGPWGCLEPFANAGTAVTEANRPTGGSLDDSQDGAANDPRFTSQSDRAVVDDVQWFDGVDSLAVFRSSKLLTLQSRIGRMEITDESVSLASTDGLVRLPLAMVERVTVAKGWTTHMIMLTTGQGCHAAFQVLDRDPNEVIRRTDALGSLLADRLAASRSRAKSTEH